MCHKSKENITVYLIFLFENIYNYFTTNVCTILEWTIGPAMSQDL